MLKRILACFCSFLVVFSFCCQCFVVLADGVIEPGSHGGGGAGNRGEYISYNRCEPDTSAKVSSLFKIDWGDEDSRSNLFHYCLGLAGAVFSDDTTLKSVYSQFRTIYGSDDPETLEKIFYVGTDGQLYFTDDFLKQFRSIVDENAFNQGVFSVPYTTNESFYQNALSVGCLSITNSISSCLSGDDARLMIRYGDYFNTGFSTSDLYAIFPFSSFSVYKKFVESASSPSSSGVSPINVSLFYSSDSQFVLSSNILPWYTVPGSDGTFSIASTGNAKYATFSSSQKTFSVSSYPYIPGYPRYTAYAGFVGAGTFEAYRTVEHMQYYLSGGTGVIKGNTYYALDNKQDADNITGRDWKAYYQGLQKQYRQLAGEVKSGNKTLKEINQTLSDEILDTVADISQDVTQQTNYLKKILNELESISGKLTYSNVVETVSAASNLLSAVCDVLDSLFSSDDGVFSLLDFVETYVLDGTGKTIASVMQTVFPFSLPHDFYLILELLSVNPETPQVHFKFDLARLGMSYDYSYTANDFEKLAYMTRFFSSVGFVLLLINFTNKILKK